MLIQYIFLRISLFSSVSGLNLGEFQCFILCLYDQIIVGANSRRKKLEVKMSPGENSLVFSIYQWKKDKLSRNKNRLGVVKSADTVIIIPPNSEMKINGYIDREVPYHPVCAFLQNTHKSVIPQDLDISPSVVSYKYQNNNNNAEV